MWEVNEVESEPCTLGIDPTVIKTAGGILPYLLAKGVTVIDELVETQCVGEPSRKPTYETKYATIRTSIKTQYDTKRMLLSVDLNDYLTDQRKHNIPNHGKPRVLTFTKNGHTFSMQKKAGTYTVKEIDGKSVLSFSRKEIMGIKEETTIFSYTCTLKRNSIRRKWDYCTPDQEDEE